LASNYSIKWKIEDPNSKSEASFAEVTLDLTVIHYCSNNIVSASGVSLAAETYVLADDQVAFSP
jgi:hypothetical protein